MKKLLLLILLLLGFQTIFAQSLLWEITGKHLKKTSYLYGTIHIQDKRVFNFGDIVKEKFNSCDAYAMEILLDEIDKETVRKIILMKNDNSLDKLISKEDYELLNKVFKKKTGMSITLLNKTKPFFIASQLMQASMNKEMKTALDIYFLNMAKENNKKIYGIEKLKDQVDAIDKIPLKEQCEMLMKSVRDTSSEKDKYDELLKVYLKGDLDKMLELSKDTTMPENFNEIFLTNRNKHMAKKIAKLCKKQSTFNAIGATHLCGEQGVINLLRKKGYTVKPVKFEFKKQD